MKIAEILTSENLAEGVAVLETSGTIEAVFDFEDKSTPEYKMTIQNLLIKDETGQIYVCLKNCPEQSKDIKGHDLTLKSVHNKKHGVLGVKVNEYVNKQGKKVRKLVITPSAEFLVDRPLDHTEVPKQSQESPKPQALPPKQPPITASPEVFTPKMPDWDRINKQKARSICLSYANELAIGNKIKIEDITTKAQEFVEYIYGEEITAPDDSSDVREMEAQTKSEENPADLYGGEDIPF